MMINNVWKEDSRKRPYIAAGVLAVLLVAEIFFVGGVLAYYLGELGQVIHELIIGILGIAVIAAFGGRMRGAFPMHKIQGSRVAGSLLIWMGMFEVMNIAVVILDFFFPEEMIEANSGVNELLNTMPMWLGMITIALVPAVCEEIAFRGALFSCFRKLKNKWIAILVVALFFGACHGSFYRMVPTAILGAAIGYVLVETDNLFYCILIHFVNNACSVIATGIIQLIYHLVGTDYLAEMTEVYTSGLSDVGSTICGAWLAPFLLYAGNYLLHRGLPGYDRGLFPLEKKRERRIVIWSTLGLVSYGYILEMVSGILWLIFS